MAAPAPIPARIVLRAPPPKSAAAQKREAAAAKQAAAAARTAAREEDARRRAAAQSAELRAALAELALAYPPAAEPGDVGPGWTLADVAARTVGGDWAPTFAAAAGNLRLVSEILDGGSDPCAALPAAVAPGAYYPSKGEVFRAFYLTPLREVRAVIIAPEPPTGLLLGGAPAACGLAFSSRPGAPAGPALARVFEELAASVPGFAAADGDLTPWARRGVLLLSAALTVPAAGGSHGDVWRGFAKRIVEAVARQRPLAAFFLWGAAVQDEFLPLLGSKATVFADPEPTTRNPREPFVGCGHFARFAEHLALHGEPPFDWGLPGGSA